MLKVAVVTDYFPTSAEPWAGHSAYQTLRLLAVLVDLHVFYPVPTYPRLLTPASRQGKVVDPTWQPPDVAVTYLPYRAIPVVSRPFNGAIIDRALRPHVQAFKPDVILSYVVYPNGFAAVRIARALGCPVVLTAIGSDLNRIPDRLIGMLARWTLRRASFVTTVSEDLCTTAHRLGANPDTTRAKLNGCDTKLFHPSDCQQARAALNLDPNSEVIVYVGRLDLRKGLLELVEAVAALRVTHPLLHCYFLGDGPAKVPLNEAIARRHIASAFTLVPSCRTEQVAVWMTAANLVTLPSYNEGCPNVVIEALCCGRPVVATRVGGIPELMDSASGRLVPARDVPALTSALDEVLNLTWDAAAISSRHSRSWGDVAVELVSIFEETLQRA